VLGAITIYNPDVFTATLWSIPSVGPIVLRADPLSGLFLLMVGLVFLPTSIFATSALQPLTGRYNVRVYALFFFVLFISIVINRERRFY
jgi:formate hydrogenlyase subunit 3/multisubunit Na+/H+ antiporter MnhD subunit